MDNTDGRTALRSTMAAPRVMVIALGGVISVARLSASHDGRTGGMGMEDAAPRMAVTTLVPPAAPSTFVPPDEHVASLDRIVALNPEPAQGWPMAAVAVGFSEFVTRLAPAIVATSMRLCVAEAHHPSRTWGEHRPTDAALRGHMT